MFESSKLFMINTIMILYMDGLISTLISSSTFLFLRYREFGIIKTQIRYYASPNFISELEWRLY